MKHVNESIKLDPKTTHISITSTKTQGTSYGGLQLMSLIPYDTPLINAFEEFTNVSEGPFTAAVSTQDERATALQELGSHTGTIYSRIGKLFQS